MQTIVDHDGKASLYPDFFDSEQACLLYESLINGLQWQNESIRMYGKLIPVPRLVCWYGDEGANYAYSGIDHAPLPWNPVLKEIRNKIETATQLHFNSVLGNLYRDERDSMGWHADKEKELGINPSIASVSLGESRSFKLRHNRTKEITSINLPHGSLLLMTGALQHHWQHSLPKCREPKSPRINLTFRLIVNNNDQREGK